MVKDVSLDIDSEELKNQGKNLRIIARICPREVGLIYRNAPLSLFLVSSSSYNELIMFLAGQTSF